MKKCLNRTEKGTRNKKKEEHEQIDYNAGEFWTSEDERESECHEEPCRPNEDVGVGLKKKGKRVHDKKS
jgi:hypothetical protein